MTGHNQLMTMTVAIPTPYCEYFYQKTKNDARWKNYIGRELDGGHKSSYDDTLKENKYIEVVKHFYKLT
uniref:Uncharacterized protein n=1 Tax=Rhizophagus irregularis (strain DAOM 181602 / DAOM 197198 / MUCL 43194) TaxID=747089 RepID=U9TLL1_RHIID